MPRSKQFDKKKVLNKAMNLFWKKGYHATSMQDLVDYLGINRASIYDTYGSKKQLFDDALSQYRRVYTEDVIEALNEENEIRLRIRKLFEAEIERMIGDKEIKGCFVVNSITELIPGDKQIEKALSEDRQALQDHLFQVLKRAQEHGEIKPEKDIKSISSLFVTLYNGLKVDIKTKPSKEELTSSVNTILSVLD